MQFYSYECLSNINWSIVAKSYLIRTKTIAVCKIPYPLKSLGFVVLNPTDAMQYCATNALGLPHYQALLPLKNSGSPGETCTKTSSSNFITRFDFASLNPLIQSEGN